MTHRPRCADTHKPLVLPNGRSIIGGSCLDRPLHDISVFIPLDASHVHRSRVSPRLPYRVFPYIIQDANIPEDTTSFTELINWLAEVSVTESIFVGCIGGHGRTGMVLAALVSVLGVSDAVTYVRSKYCTKAVETSGQIAFLNKAFGIVKVPPSKESYAYKGIDDHIGTDDYLSGVSGHGHWSKSSVKLPRQKTVNKIVLGMDVVIKPVIGVHGCNITGDD